VATTASDWTAPTIGGSQHFALRRLHSLTGLIFGGYLVVHLLVNATIAQMGSVYQVQVSKIHDLPMLWALEWLLIYLPMLYHTVYGIWIFLTGQPNVGHYPYAKNWFYLIQRISAFVILGFLLFHVMSLKYGLLGANLAFSPEQASMTIHRHMVFIPVLTWIVYPLGILASCYHLANGFWTAAITWGLTISDKSQRRFGFVCTGLFMLLLVLGMTALFAGFFITPAGAAAPAVHMGAEG